MSGKSLLLLVIALLVVLLTGGFLFASHHHPILLHGNLHAAHGNTIGARQLGLAPSETELEASRRVKKEIAAMGREWNESARDQTMQLYASLRGLIDVSEFPPPVRVVENLPPGVDLKLFLPADPFNEPGTTGVLLYQRDQDEEYGATFDYLGHLMNFYGSIGVTIGIETESLTRKEAAIRIGQILDQVHGMVPGHGGDPDTIILFTHGQAAAPVLRYLFQHDLHVEGRSVPAATVFASGSYALQEPAFQESIATYTGTLPAILLWTGEFDSPQMKKESRDLQTTLCGLMETCPQLTELDGHNRLSHLLSLGTADTQALANFMVFYHTIR